MTSFPPPSRPVPEGAGPGNSLTDVPGLRVGHATLDGAGWLTGVTVVVAPPGGAVGGVDVRGGGPGTRETDLLDPRNAVERAHAVMLSGGSAYGLGAAQGVMTRLAALGRGVPVGTDPLHVVPIVPAAILFDLGRGGVFDHYPDGSAGQAAFDAALGPAGSEPVALGNVGAGTGALAGQLKGGTGSASTVLGDDVLGPGGPGRTVTVGALAAVNAVGAVADERDGALYGTRFGLPGEFDWLRPPSPGDLASAGDMLAYRGLAGPPRPRPLNTTIGVIACDAALTKAQCGRLAGAAQDGLARAIRPAHSMFDGDTIFGLSTGDGPPPTPLEFHAILTAAADCFTRAIVAGVLAARTVTVPDGRWLGYLDAFPSARS